MVFKVDLRFPRLVARIRLVRPDGTSVGDRLARIAGSRFRVDGDGWITLDPAPALRLHVDLHGPGIDADALLRIRYDDPRARAVAVGTIELDGAEPRSEHVLIVREP